MLLCQEAAMSLLTVADKEAHPSLISAAVGKQDFLVVMHANAEAVTAIHVKTMSTSQVHLHSPQIVKWLVRTLSFLFLMRYIWNNIQKLHLLDLT